MVNEKKKNDLLESLYSIPVYLAQLLGFTLLCDIHNEWIKDMVYGVDDETLQAHRGSYKTTCVAFALSLIMVLFPNDKILFIRKTDTDVKEIIAQVKKILLKPIMILVVRIMYDVELKLIKDTDTEISTNLGVNDPRGTSQLVGMGTKSSITGKHFDRIFTDDIVNKEDRESRAEREKTKTFYQELQNIKNRGGRIYNTGTPWHKDDAFTIMPAPKQYDCYSTGLIPEETIEILRSKMTASLFSANYELKHIASDKVLFVNQKIGADPSNLMNGESHVDASYGGEDGTAFTVINKKDGKYYVLGKLRQMHVDVCIDEFIDLHQHYLCRSMACEDNGDKGYLAKDLRKRHIKVFQYHEEQNKYTKIASYLKHEWENVIFCEGTDQEYIDQVLEYNIDAEHDDAPDSLASAVRKLWNKKKAPTDETWKEFL